MPLVYAHELVSEYNLYFLNGSHFSSILHVALLTTWFNLEPSYLAQLCICTGAIHTKNYAAVDNILKIIIFKDFHILHFPPMHNVLFEYRTIHFTLLVSVDSPLITETSYLVHTCTYTPKYKQMNY